MEPTMPENKCTINPNQESPLIVTPLKPHERPVVSARQQRIGESRREGPGRRCRKDIKLAPRKVTRKSNVMESCTAAVVVTAPWKASWDPKEAKCFPSPVKESNVSPNLVENKSSLSDHVKVLFPPREIIYSDSEIGLVCSRSSFYVEPFEEFRTEMALSHKRVKTPSSGRADIVDASKDVEERYLNKPPGELKCSQVLCDSLDDVSHSNPGNKPPYRQVWHNLWEHENLKVAREIFVDNCRPPKHNNQLQIHQKNEGNSVSVTNIWNSRNVQLRKFRRGVFHPVGPTTQTRVSLRSKNASRVFGKSVYHRGSHLCKRTAQRKPSQSNDTGIVGDAESVLDQGSAKLRIIERTRRCRKPYDIPRVVITAAPHLVTEEPTVNSMPNGPSHPTSAPAGTGRLGMNELNRTSGVNRIAKERPRFSVPIKASRVPLHVLYKEMDSHIQQSQKRTTNPSTLKHDPLKLRSFPTRSGNITEQVFITPDTSNHPNAACRLVNKPTVHFNVIDKVRASSSRSPRPRHCMSACYDQTRRTHKFQIGPAAVIGPGFTPEVRNIAAIQPPRRPPALAGIKPRHDLEYDDRGAHRKSNAPYWALHDYPPGLPIGTKQTFGKSFALAPPSVDTSEQSYLKSPTYPIPSRERVTLAPRSSYREEVPVPPDYFYDAHSSDQTSTTFHFTCPNAPEVRISPPTSAALQVDTSDGPGRPLQVDKSPILNNHYPMNNAYLPQYFESRAGSLRPPDPIIKEELQGPEFVDNMLSISPRPFMPLVDFSRMQPPPKLLPHESGSSREENSEGNGVLREFQNTRRTVPLFPIPESPVQRSGKKLLIFSAQVPSVDVIVLNELTDGCSSVPQSNDEDTSRYNSVNILNDSVSGEANAITFKKTEQLERKNDFSEDRTETAPEALTVLEDTLTSNDECEIRRSSARYSEGNESALDTFPIKDDSLWGSVNFTMDDCITQSDMVDFIVSDAVVKEEAALDSYDFGGRTHQLMQSPAKNSVSNCAKDVLKCASLNEPPSRGLNLRIETKLSTVTENSNETLQPDAARSSPTIMSQDVRTEEQNMSKTSEERSSKHDESRTSALDNAFYFGNLEEYKALMVKHGVILKDTDVYHSEGSEQITSKTSNDVNVVKDLTSFNKVSLSKKSVGDNTLASQGGSSLDKRRTSLPEPKTSYDTSSNLRSFGKKFLGRDSPASQSGSSFSQQATFASIKRDSVVAAKSYIQNIRKNDQYQKYLETPNSKNTTLQVADVSSRNVEPAAFRFNKTSGLSLRFQTTVVDVPPVIKETESVGTCTAGLYTRGNEKNQIAANKDMDNTYDTTSAEIPLPVKKPATSNQYSSTTTLNVSSPCEQCFCEYGSQLKAPDHALIDEQLKPLQPSLEPCSREFINICNLVALRRFSFCDTQGDVPTDTGASIERVLDKPAKKSCNEERTTPHELTGRHGRHHDRRVSFRAPKRETEHSFKRTDSIGEVPISNLHYIQDDRTERRQIPSGAQVHARQKFLDCTVDSSGSMSPYIKTEPEARVNDGYEKLLQSLNETHHCNDLDSSSFSVEGRSLSLDVHSHASKGIDNPVLNRYMISRAKLEKTDVIEEVSSPKFTNDVDGLVKVDREVKQESVVLEDSSPDESKPGTSFGEGLDYDNVIALNRKPSYAFGKTDRELSVRKKGILKISKKTTKKNTQLDVSSSPLPITRTERPFEDQSDEKILEMKKEQTDVSIVLDHSFSKEKPQAGNNCNSRISTRRIAKSLRSLATFLALSNDHPVSPKKHSKDEITSAHLEKMPNVSIEEKHTVVDKKTRKEDNRNINKTLTFDNAVVQTIIPQDLVDCPKREKLPSICLTLAETTDVLIDKDSPDSTDGHINKSSSQELINAGLTVDCLESDRTLRSCVYSAMRRYMAKRQNRQEPYGNYHQLTDREYSSFTYSGLPLYNEELLAVDRRQIYTNNPQSSTDVASSSEESARELCTFCESAYFCCDRHKYSASQAILTSPRRNKNTVGERTLPISSIGMNKKPPLSHPTRVPGIPQKTTEAEREIRICFSSEKSKPPKRSDRHKSDHNEKTISKAFSSMMYVVDAVVMCPHRSRGKQPSTSDGILPSELCGSSKREVSVNIVSDNRIMPAIQTSPSDMTIIDRQDLHGYSRQPPLVQSFPPTDSPSRRSQRKFRRPPSPTTAPPMVNYHPRTCRECCSPVTIHRGYRSPHRTHLPVRYCDRHYCDDCSKRKDRCICKKHYKDFEANCPTSESEDMFYECCRHGPDTDRYGYCRAYYR